MARGVLVDAGRIASALTATSATLGEDNGRTPGAPFADFDLPLGGLPEDSARRPEASCMTAEGLWENPATIPKAHRKDPGSTAGGFRVVPRGMWGDFGSSMREPCQDMWSTVCGLRHCSRMANTGRRKGSSKGPRRAPGIFSCRLRKQQRTAAGLWEHCCKTQGVWLADSGMALAALAQGCWRTGASGKSPRQLREDTGSNPGDCRRKESPALLADYGGFREDCGGLRQLPG